MVASTIKAFSEGDFSSSNNATTLEFATGRSAAAGSDGGRLMKLTSAGVLEFKNLTSGDDAVQNQFYIFKLVIQILHRVMNRTSIIFAAPDEGCWYGCNINSRC